MGRGNNGWRTHPFAITLRNFGRAVGVNRWLGLLLSGRGYETVFEEAIFAAILSGDCAWDVGANVGLYAVKFAEKVGAQGKVFAFEPSPINRVHLQTAVEKHRNVAIVPLALGDQDAVMKIAQGADPLGATSRLVVGTGTSAGGGVDVRVVRGDTLVKDGTVAPPNVVKIDAEGFELDVVHGLGEVLRSPALRAVFIEVHFALLKERGLAGGPRQIESLLSESGFRCRWTDLSHIVALRTG